MQTLNSKSINLSRTLFLFCFQATYHRLITAFTSFDYRYHRLRQWTETLRQPVSILSTRYQPDTCYHLVNHHRFQLWPAKKPVKRRSTLYTVPRTQSPLNPLSNKWSPWKKVHPRRNGDQLRKVRQIREYVWRRATRRIPVQLILDPNRLLRRLREVSKIIIPKSKSRLNRKFGVLIEGMQRELAVGI